MNTKPINTILVLWIVLLLSWCTINFNQQKTNTTPTVTAQPSDPYKIGSVDTAFQLIGADHKIEVGAVPDPKVAGVTCFYSRARTWGIRWSLGIAEDTSDASVACRQTGPISFTQAIGKTEEIRNESSSFFFKKLRIVRFYDDQSNSLIYLVYSDKLIDGSPKNSISAVALESVKALLK